MYIRTKTRKNASGNLYIYAYMARMKHPKKAKPRQKIVEYLGRVYEIERKENKSPQIEGLRLRDMLKAMVITELENHGFVESTKEIFKRADIEVNINALTIKNTKKNKNACLKLNQGILCHKTLKNIIKYEPPKEILPKIARDLAKTIIEAGLPGDQQSTILVFNEIRSMINNDQRRST